MMENFDLYVNGEKVHFSSLSYQADISETVIEFDAELRGPIGNLEQIRLVMKNDNCLVGEWWGIVEHGKAGHYRFTKVISYSPLWYKVDLEPDFIPMRLFDPKGDMGE